MKNAGGFQNLQRLPRKQRSNRELRLHQRRHLRGYPCWFADEIREGFHPGSCPDGNAFAGMPVEDRDVSLSRIFVSGSAVTKNLFTGEPEKNTPIHQ